MSLARLAITSVALEGRNKTGKAFLPAVHGRPVG